MNELALFAGAGGGILAGKLLGWRTVCAVERNAYGACILAERQNEGFLEAFPIWSDVETFDGRAWRGVVDVVSGGFPCQDISAAGKGAGLSGARSGMWFQMLRIIREVRAEWVFIENSDKLIGRGISEVSRGLSEAGYAHILGILSAAACGANHERQRCWIVGRQRIHPGRWEEGQGAVELDRYLPAADADSLGRNGRPGPRADDGGFALIADDAPNYERNGHEGPQRRVSFRRWPAEPDVVRVVHGVPHGLDRIAALGNAQVPRVAAAAFTILSRKLI